MASALYLVPGGAGFLGINLCRALLAQGHRVRTLDIAPFSYPERAAVEVVDGDIRDAPVVAAAMRGVDVVVHCAAALPLAPQSDIRSTTVEGTRLLLDAAAAEKVPRFIFISSTAVYGIPDHCPLVESDPRHGVGPYGESKIVAEDLCAQGRRRGQCVSVLRPKTFVGPERLGVFELLYSWAAEGRNFPLLGRGENRYQLLDVSDLCNAIVLCATLPVTAVNDTFNVGAQQFGTMRENVQAVLDRAGYGGRTVAFPVQPMVLALKLLKLLQLSPLYQWVYETAAEESYVSTEKIARALGFHASFSNQEALVRNYDWYVAHRRESLAQAGTSHRVPWKKGVLQLAKYFF